MVKMIYMIVLLLATISTSISTLAFSLSVNSRRKNVSFLLNKYNNNVSSMTRYSSVDPLSSEATESVTQINPKKKN